MIISSFDKLEPIQFKGDSNYGFTRRRLIPTDQMKNCSVSFYELEPGASNCPYHYHTVNEEVFYIISGTGTLKMPEGDKTVAAGDIIYFPADDSGAHKLTNNSNEKLVYIDFDTSLLPEIAVYPDSGKIGFYNGGDRAIFKRNTEVDYYDGE